MQERWIVISHDLQSYQQSLANYSDCKSQILICEGHRKFKKVQEISGNVSPALFREVFLQTSSY